MQTELCHNLIRTMGKVDPSSVDSMFTPHRYSAYPVRTRCCHFGQTSTRLYGVPSMALVDSNWTRLPTTRMRHIEYYCSIQVSRPISIKLSLDHTVCPAADQVEHQLPVEPPSAMHDFTDWTLERYLPERDCRMPFWKRRYRQHVNVPGSTLTIVAAQLPHGIH